jgi:hypothetical protein
VPDVKDQPPAHFPSGEMAFNSYTSFAVSASKHVPGTSPVAGLLKFPGVDEPSELEHWNPKLKLIRETEVAEYPTAVRLYNRLLATSTTLSRKGTIVLHYRFWEQTSLYCAVRHRHIVPSRPARRYGRMLAHSGSVPFRFQERS